MAGSTRIFQSFHHQKQQGLPVSLIPRPAADDSNKIINSSSSSRSEEGQLGGIGIRKRALSSLSLKMNMAEQVHLQHPSSAMMMFISSSLFRRSKSDGAGSGGGGEYSEVIRKWWEWGWGWILSRKPSSSFLGGKVDLEMNEVAAESGISSWTHIFYKLKSELAKLIPNNNNNSSNNNNVGLPQTIHPTSKNFYY